MGIFIRFLKDPGEGLTSNTLAFGVDLDDTIRPCVHEYRGLWREMHRVL